MACESYTIDTDRVITILGVDSSTDVSEFVDAAKAVIDHLLADCAASQWDDLGASRIGNWLAAHFYAVAFPTEAMLRSQSANGASHSLNVPNAGEGFMATPYGRTAISLDPSGCLKRYDQNTQREPLKISWVGKRGDARRIESTTDNNA